MFKLKYQRYILLLSTILILNSCQSSSSKNSLANEAISEKIDDFMNSVIDEKRLPGLVFSVAKKNQVLYSKAFGVSNVDTQQQVRKNTLFHIASTNKAITSLLIAILVDEDILTWDTKAQDIYEGFTLSDDTYSSQITIRQLLDMSSGLPEGLDNLPNQARGLLEDLTDIELNAPKTEYRYSNLSVSIAGYLAVLAYKKFDHGQITEEDLNTLHSGYEMLLKEKVLIPIGMTHSYLNIDDAKASNNMSHSHHLENDIFVVSESEDEPNDIFAPAGGLKSTTTDMIKYMMVETQQGVTAEGKRIVSTKNMIERQTLSKGVATDAEYGLGLEVKTLSNGMTYIGHTGSYDDFNSAIGLFPSQEVSFVLLSNGDSKDVLNLTGDEIENKMIEWVNQFESI